MKSDYSRLVDALGFASQLLVLTRVPGVRVPQEWPIDLWAFPHHQLAQVLSLDLDRLNLSKIPDFSSA